MSLFVKGNIYRRREIHEKYGGQQQGGMSTPANKNLIFLFTGESGEQHGYSDGWADDGLFFYTGEGQRGDMQFVRANLELRDHVENEKEVHLFSSAAKAHVRYVGQFICSGHHFDRAPDTEGNQRRIIIFELTPIEDFSEEQSETAVSVAPLSDSTSLAELKRRALDKSVEFRTPRERKVAYRARSEAIRLYALKRAEGNCEGCGSPAPFKRRDGTPYLEVHHLLRLSDGGPDRPDAVVAICANCHRRAHYAVDAVEYNTSLAKVAADKEM